MNLTEILTQDLSDPSLTRLPLLAPGVYEFSIKNARLCREQRAGGDTTTSLRALLMVVSPALKFQTDEPWPPSMPVPFSIMLTPTGKATPEMIKQNLAAFLQAVDEKTLLTPEEVNEFEKVPFGETELPLPRFDGKRFVGKVSIRPDAEGNPRNNIRPVPAKRS